MVPPDRFAEDEARVAVGVVASEVFGIESGTDGVVGVGSSGAVTLQ